MAHVREQDNDWERLGHHIVDRMRDLKIDQVELSRRSGLSDRTVSGFTTASVRGAPRAKTVWSLEQGLGWTSGSVDEVLAGGVPTIDADHSPTPGDVELRSRLEELAQIVESQGALLSRLATAGAEIERRLEHLEARTG